jgi:HD-like signal output (HDOD) protein
MTILTEKISHDTLILPTLPEIALKVRRAADDPEVDLDKITDVIRQDPSLSARIIKIANSGQRGRSNAKVTDLNQAAIRIGLNQIKNIATALAMEQLFVTKSDVVREHLNRCWRNTVDITVHALTIHKLYVEEMRDRSVSADELTLCAMVSHIGILPILSEAERHSDIFGEENFLNDAVEKLSCRIAGIITREWDFPSSSIDVAETWRKPSVSSSKRYVDFVRLAAIACGIVVDDDHVKSCIEKHIIQDKNFQETFVYKRALETSRNIFA